MTALLQVTAALARTARGGQVSVLATVVRTEGSTYRRIGARLVALPDGSHVGAVSAGCVEPDVVLRAAQVRTAGMSELRTYDTRSPNDLIWGSGAGCGGMTDLLLEPLDPEQALAKAELLRGVAVSRRPSLLATIIQASGVGLRPGDQGVLPHVAATMVGFDEIATPLRALVEATAREMLWARSSAAVHHVCGKQELHVAYEVCSPRVRLGVCGAGPDATPLVAMARLMGWHVTLIDHRPAMLLAARWPDVDCILARSPAEIAAAVAGADCDAVVVMNHNYERDLEFLTAWLGSPVSYIGILGPRHRSRRMLATLDPGEALLMGAAQRIRAPVGLDLGGETAEEIALSIVAEVQAAYTGRGAGALARCAGPIHRRSNAPAMATS